MWMDYTCREIAQRVVNLLDGSCAPDQCLSSCATDQCLSSCCASAHLISACLKWIQVSVGGGAQGTIEEWFDVFRICQVWGEGY